MNRESQKAMFARLKESGVHVHWENLKGDEDFGDGTYIKLVLPENKIIEQLRKQPMTAEQIVDSVTRTTEDQRLSNNVMTQSRLSQLEHQNKIRFHNGKWVLSNE